MYVADRYAAPIEDEMIAWRIFRVRLFLDSGHPFEVIDNISAQDYLDIMAVREGDSKANEAKARSRRGRK